MKINIIEKKKHKKHKKHKHKKKKHKQRINYIGAPIYGVPLQYEPRPIGYTIYEQPQRVHYIQSNMITGGTIAHATAGGTIAHATAGGII